MLQNPQSKLGTYIQDTKYVPYKPLMRSNTSINKIEEQERVQREEQEQVQRTRAGETE
jgi:hypothetical protein